MEALEPKTKLVVVFLIIAVFERLGNKLSSTKINRFL
jgi:hypothetical protein